MTSPEHPTPTDVPDETGDLPPSDGSTASPTADPEPPAVVVADDDGGRVTSRGGVVRIVGVVLALMLSVVFAVVAIAVPYLDTNPREIPVGAVGESASQLEEMLESIQPGGFDVVTYDDAEALREAVLVREIYAGFSIDETSATALISSGSGSVMSQYLGSVGGALGASVEDVAPGSQDDPSGYGIHVGAALAAVAGLLGAVLIGRLAPGRLKTQLIATLGLAIGLGVAIAGALELVGSIDGALLPVAAVVALAVLAVALPALGLMAIGGLVLAAAFALLVVVPGIGLAGITSAPPLLPAGWGAVGQMLPGGALGSLVRSTAFFSGGGGLAPALVLLAWVVAGLALVAVAHLTRRSAGTPTTVVAEPVAEDDDVVEPVAEDDDIRVDEPDDDDTADEPTGDDDIRVDEPADGDDVADEPAADDDIRTERER
ncbi:hypothetical protein [Georgenia sunbinii]|uniref:hypothetical protein n=1 Tax=Georgenia sunbinii TaxID=3117728 RepID=UPI002F268A8F